jgi:ribosomal protein L4
LQSIFLTRLKEGRVTIIENLSLNQPSTLIINNILKLFNFKRILFIDLDNKNIELSIRNISKVKFLPYSGLNTFDITSYPHIILTRTVFQIILFSFFS